MIELFAIENMQAQYESLSSTEREPADYILKNTTKVADFTVKDLTLASGVSGATAARMCQHARFKGYWPFRMSLSKELVRYQNYEIDNTANSVGGVFREYSKIMPSIADNINSDIVYGCVDLLRSCGQIRLVTSGNTTPTIEHMRFRLERLGIKCTFSGVADYYMNQINLAGSSDSVLIVLQSGSTRGVIDGMALVKQRNLKVIVITIYKSSSLAELADYVIESKGDFSRFDFYRNYSHLYEMAVAEALMDILAKDEKIQVVVQEKNTDMLEFPSDMKLQYTIAGIPVQQCAGNVSFRVKIGTIKRRNT